MKTEKIFVIGHKNPDTDSICSAIAYADIKNRTAPKDKKYVPKRAGQINQETEYVLNRFHVDPPGYISNVGTQVKDMDIRTSPEAHKDISLKRAWDIMMKNELVTLPVRDEKEALEGIVTIGDIAKTYMDTTDSYLLGNARSQYYWIADTVDGLIIVGDKDKHFEHGKVMVAAGSLEIMEAYIEEGDLLIVGNRDDVQIQAMNCKARCIVVCLGSEISEEVKKMANETGTVIIMSPYDTFTVARLINQSIPIGYIMKTENLVSFHTEDFTDDIQEVMAKYRHRAFPVVNKRGKCVGTISRRNLLGMNKKKLILVDHNEKDQAVDNIEKADILEIIDHHKLGRLETMAPLMFRNQPVGCTATILYQMYGEQKLEIPAHIAGLLCSAIISDTLMFRSPTCTLADKMAAGALALIAGIDIEKFAKEMFTAGSNLRGKAPEEIFYQDYKKFIADGDITFGVGQISSMDEEELEEVKLRILPLMKSECGNNGVSKIYFMLTNIINESTELLYCGEDSQKMAAIAFGKEPEGESFLLEKVVSRKKQLIPALMEAAQILNS